MSGTLRAIQAGLFLFAFTGGPVFAGDPLADDIVRSLTGGVPQARQGLTRSLKPREPRTRGIAVDEAVRMEPRTSASAVMETPPMPAAPAITAVDPGQGRPLAPSLPGRAQGSVPGMGLSPTAAMPAMPATPSFPVGTIASTQPLGGPRSYDLYVTFPSGSAQLSYEARLKLRSLARALSDARLAGSRIRIAGHTDARGSDRMNMDLSLRRAEAVRRHLWLEYGIDASRLETVGFGERRLKDPSRPAAQINRRVEIINLGS